MCFFLICGFQIYNDVDLLSLQSGGDIKKYALKVFAVLFTLNEMVNGMIGPNGQGKDKRESNPGGNMCRIAKT